MTIDPAERDRDQRFSLAANRATRQRHDQQSASKRCIERMENIVCDLKQSVTIRSCEIEAQNRSRWFELAEAGECSGATDSKSEASSAPAASAGCCGQRSCGVNWAGRNADGEYRRLICVPLRLSPLVHPLLPS